MTARLRRALERGEVSEMLVVVFVAVVLMIGLVVDGGAKMTAAGEAAGTAQEAARAGAQQLDSLPQDGERAVLDTNAASGAAQSYLDQAGASGSVRVIDGATVEVTVTATEDTVFLGMIGIGSVSATRTARIELVQGQAEVVP